MANFEPALAKTLAHEGGYSNNQNDAGGETFCGISRRWHPKWEGWVAIDGLKTHGAKILPNDPTLRPQVVDFYRAEFWDKLHCDEIESQEIAEYLFDFAVNSGPEDAVKALQMAWNSFNLTKISADGIIGDETKSVYEWSFSPKVSIPLLLSLRSYRLAHILTQAGRGKIHPSMLEGLAKRCLS